MGPGFAIIGAVAALSGAAPASCPADVPTQAITVVNQSRVGRFALAKIENAVVAQSMQLRAAWRTPCVQFAREGWPVYLEPSGGYVVHYFAGDTGQGSFQDNTACSHRSDTSRPCVLVSVGQNWTIDVSHEILEMLANPYGHSSEVCDPVEDWSYKVRGVWMSDFVFPAGSARYDQMQVRETR